MNFKMALKLFRNGYIVICDGDKGIKVKRRKNKPEGFQKRILY